MVRTFAVIGDPINHSLSPSIHNAAFHQTGMDCTYIAYRVPRGELAVGLDSLRAAGIEGFNVTIPHKVDIMQHLDSVSKECSLVGAANLVQDRDGRRRGFNTDMDGFLRPILSRNIPLSGCRVLLLGAGGAARAAASGLASKDISHIHVCNRDVQKARSLAAHCSEMGVSSSSGPLPSYVEGGFDLVVNATSVGMNGGPPPADMSRIPPDAVAYDMVYKPMQTSFLAQAAEAGAATILGWEMLLEQAVISFSILLGMDAPVSAMKRVLTGGFS